APIQSPLRKVWRVRLAAAGAVCSCGKVVLYFSKHRWEKQRSVLLFPPVRQLPQRGSPFKRECALARSGFIFQVARPFERSPMSSAHGNVYQKTTANEITLCEST